jgi:hypothetical protein
LQKVFPTKKPEGANMAPKKAAKKAAATGRMKLPAKNTDEDTVNVAAQQAKTMLDFGENSGNTVDVEMVLLARAPDAFQIRCACVQCLYFFF